MVEVIYEKKEQDLNLNKDNVLSIDLGLNNLCTCISNVGIKPFIVNGKIIKSFNQWYNKKRARLMSYIGDKGISIGIGRKVFDDSYVSGIIDSGLAFNPVRVNIL